MSPSTRLDLAPQILASRFYRNLSWMALVGTLGLGLARGPAWAANFALGAGAAFANFWILQRMVMAMGPDAPRPFTSHPFVIGSKILLGAMTALVILKLTGGIPAAFVAGLALIGPAAMLEVAYQLIYARK